MIQRDLPDSPKPTLLKRYSINTSKAQLCGSKQIQIMNTQKRILKELAALRAEGSSHKEVVLRADEDDFRQWTCWLSPPEDSLYGGCTFQLKIVVPLDYPIKPPIIKFVTPICHPNIHFKTGMHTHLVFRVHSLPFL
eukprot:Colp12_sorted_trinity150504_noHs@35729